MPATDFRRKSESQSHFNGPQGVTPLSFPPPMLVLYYSLCFGLQQYWIVAIPCTSGHAPAPGLSELYFLAWMIPLEDDLLAPSIISSFYHYPTGYVLYLLMSLPTII